MSRGLTIRVLSVLLIGLLSVSSAARVGARQDDATPSYTAIELGAIKDYPGTAGLAINAEGVIVGQAYDPGEYSGRLVVYLGEKLRALIKGEKKGSMSGGNDINASGQIVGFTQTENGASTHALLWDGKEATDLGDLGGGSSHAQAINDAGVVVGESTINPDDFRTTRPFVWADGEITELELLPKGEIGTAIDINADGIVVGFSTTGPDSEDAPTPEHAVAWTDGEPTDLGTIGGDFSQARGVNAAGQIVGYTTTAADQSTYSPGVHAVLWDGDETVDLGTLADGEFSSAEAINAAGAIVGFSSVEPGPPFGENHAFLWLDGELLDLNDLVEGSEVVFNVATDINDEGLIIALSTVEGVAHTYLLTPVES